MPTPLEELLGARPHDAPRVALVEDPAEALALRLALVDAARERIDAQYYIWEKDLAGRVLAQRLFVAADRGVKVRVLLDDVELGPSDVPWLALDIHPCIDVRVFNPFRNRVDRGWRRVLEGLMAFRRLNHRMHNKSLTVDDTATLVGGRNIGNAYFGLDVRANFFDLDVLATGTTAPEVRASFEAFWDSPHARPLNELARVRFTPLRLLERRRRLDRFATRALASLHSGPWDEPMARTQLARCAPRLAAADVAVLTDLPDKMRDGASPIADGFAALCEGAEREALLESAYFVPGAAGTAAFAAMVARGVRVRVATNSLAATDVPLVHGGYAAWRRPLLRAGVALHEVRPTLPAGLRPVLRWRRSRAALHTKAAAIDRQRAFVGSMNLDPRSARINTEIGLRIDCPAFAEQVAAALDRTTAPERSWALALDPRGRLRWHAGEGMLRREPRAGWARRLLAFVVRLLPVHDWL
ncbi:MAG: phospholipase D family protein [Xanthomonadaceae bacterium]|nr:phospholipase D family protein [Xanthomonadaceae bacterium]